MLKVKESKKKDKYLDLARELKKLWNLKYIWSARNSYQRIDTETGGLGNKRASGDHPNYSIIKISQNTEKSSGDLRRLAVILTPMKTIS